MKIRLFVLPDGSITGRYSDLILTAGLRPEKVRRVTNIEWSESQTAWVCSTITGKQLMVAPTRERCLAMEGDLVDDILRQFYMCRRDDGHMYCPDCNCSLGDVVHCNCPFCGKPFPNIYQELTWKDFNFEHLVTHAEVPKETPQAK